MYEGQRTVTRSVTHHTTIGKRWWKDQQVVHTKSIRGRDLLFRIQGPCHGQSVSEESERSETHLQVSSLNSHSAASMSSSSAQTPLVHSFPSGTEKGLYRTFPDATASRYDGMGMDCRERTGSENHQVHWGSNSPGDTRTSLSPYRSPFHSAVARWMAETLGSQTSVREVQR